MYFARNIRSVPIVLPASGAFPCSGTNRWMYSRASNSASARYGLGAALAWWGVGIALVAAYFTNLFRMMRRKVRADPEPTS